MQETSQYHVQVSEMLNSFNTASSLQACRVAKPHHREFGLIFNVIQLMTRYRNKAIRSLDQI